MIKNIIFDLGNVIVKFDKERVIHYFTNNEEEIKYLYDEILNASEWGLLDLGKITNSEAIEIINKRNKFKYVDLTQSFLREWYEKLTFNNDIIEIAKKLSKNGYNIFVLSNMAQLPYEYLKKNEFFSLCSGIVVSAYEHVKKPDKKIYELLLERYNLNAKECLFIDDDDSGRNYETANKIGILGRKIVPNDADDIKKLLSEFEIKLA